LVVKSNIWAPSIPNRLRIHRSSRRCAGSSMHSAVSIRISALSNGERFVLPTPVRLLHLFEHPDGTAAARERRAAMNWDTVKGNWRQFRGKIKEQWGKLTDDDLDRIEGKRDQLLGAVQKRYGIARDEAEKQLNKFEASVD